MLYVVHTVLETDLLLLDTCPTFTSSLFLVGAHGEGAGGDGAADRHQRRGYPAQRRARTQRDTEVSRAI